MRSRRSWTGLRHRGRRHSPRLAALIAPMLDRYAEHHRGENGGHQESFAQREEKHETFLQVPYADPKFSAVDEYRPV